MGGSTLENLTGKKYGKLTVIERAPGMPKGNGKLRTMWKCRCDCGDIVIVPASNLKCGRSKSCGKPGCKAGQQAEDLTGMVFGRLTVLSRSENYVRPSGNEDVTWLCQCECGNKTIKRTQYLKRSKCASCGCWKSERTAENKRTDLTGQRFGMLTVIQFSHVIRTNGGDNPIVIWKCVCDCGTIKEVRGNSLRAGNTKSCGCLKQSWGELEIARYLNQNGVYFKREYTFKDFVSESGFKYRFDFAVLNKKDKSLMFLIEYQGKQHFVQTGNGKFADFGRQQREITDSLKRAYCCEHNIAMYTISYNESIQTKLAEILAVYANPVPSAV